MYKLKAVATRATAFVGAVVMLGSSATFLLPGMASADALNPLTERTLTLTSSSPGWRYKDGSGNTPTTPNAAGLNYAPPGSGPNGKQTGEKFSFKVSTDSSSSRTIKAMTFQYCDSAAGLCQAPGDADPGVDVDDANKESNLNVNYTTPACGTDFEIYEAGSLASCGDWAMAVSNVENSVSPAVQTTMNNFITLSSSAGGLTPASGTKIEVVFKASANNYITNPGSGAFYVKINTYDSATASDHLPTTSDHIIDGGVTVANMMTDSIQITTKVLETMSFSVGTTNPDTVDPTDAAYGGTAGEVHGPCDPIRSNKDIQLGNSNQEYSLSPTVAYDAHSYWRLSSNSSGGATVYYSGATLSNTVGDQINAIGTTAAVSHPGMEQFGLAYDDTADTLHAAMTTAISNDQALPADQQQGFKNPELAPLIASGGSGAPSTVSATDYAHGSGTINGTYTAKFGFDPNSLTTAVPFAGYTADVIECSTGKMRYVANISPNTPAGVYTTRINYLAAPQY